MIKQKYCNYICDLRLKIKIQFLLHIFNKFRNINIGEKT